MDNESILNQLVESYKPKAHDAIDSLLQDARQSRMSGKTPIYRENIHPFGSHSTHLMSSTETPDGKHYAFPSIFPKDQTGKTTTTAYDDWIEYPDWAWKQAFDFAKKRGEAYELPSKEDALKFSTEVAGH